MDNIVAHGGTVFEVGSFLCLRENSSICCCFSSDLKACVSAFADSSDSALYPEGLHT